MTYDDLLKQLADSGELAEPWQASFEAVPRHLFIPDVALARDGSEWTTIDRSRDPEEWWEAVNSDRVIITQMDDGVVRAGQSGRLATSSCSMPSMVALMLAACDIEDGHRVLEIGTGTGWNAALLTHRLGDQHVVSIEVDRDLAEQARRALATAGARPQTVVGDGEAGWPAGAPYDRVLATCSVRQVPYSWVAQTWPGGRIVTPWRDLFSHHGKLLVLVVADDGASAAGQLVDWAAFMTSRPQRHPTGEVPVQGGTTGLTDLHPGYPLNDEAETAIGALVGDCQWWREALDGGRFKVRLDDLASGSWAVVGPLGEDAQRPYPVRQGGPRRLWDEVEAAYRWWQEAGSPEYTRFGLTVTREGQWVWLDRPDHPVPGLR